MLVGGGKLPMALRPSVEPGGTSIVAERTLSYLFQLLGPVECALGIDFLALFTPSSIQRALFRLCLTLQPPRY